MHLEPSLAVIVMAQALAAQTQLPVAWYSLQLASPLTARRACKVHQLLVSHLVTGKHHSRAIRQPAIVEIQILRVGQLVILCVPGELTTMAGRRLREAVQLQVMAQGEFCHEASWKGIAASKAVCYL